MRITGYRVSPVQGISNLPMSMWSSLLATCVVDEGTDLAPEKRKKLNYCSEFRRLLDLNDSKCDGVCSRLWEWLNPQLDSGKRLGR